MEDLGPDPANKNLVFINQKKCHRNMQNNSVVLHHIYSSVSAAVM